MKDFYKIGYIYKLQCYGKLPYYGSTHLQLKDRLSKHHRDYRRWKRGKRDYCSSFKLIETGKPVSIHEIERHENIYRKDLEKREGYYQRTFPCCNIYIASGLSRTQYSKQYREKNKEKINQKFNCPCGGRYTKANKARHFKQKIHKDWVKKKKKKIVVIKKNS